MMRRIAILFTGMLFLIGYSCIKKKAIKYDPELVGTWVSKSDSLYTWLIITPDGQGNYSTLGNDEGDGNGEVNYSLFEKKLRVGHRKFKVVEWLTGKTDNVSSITTREYRTLKDTTYSIDMKMILKATVFQSARTIVFYRVHQ